eukprot:363318-Chlamydomonas_euryale.AAC.4
MPQALSAAAEHAEMLIEHSACGLAVIPVCSCSWLHITTLESVTMTERGSINCFRVHTRSRESCRIENNFPNNYTNCCDCVAYKVLHGWAQAGLLHAHGEQNGRQAGLLPVLWGWGRKWPVLLCGDGDGGANGLLCGDGGANGLLCGDGA